MSGPESHDDRPAPTGSADGDTDAIQPIAIERAAPGPASPGSPAAPSGSAGPPPLLDVGPGAGDSRLHGAPLRESFWSTRSGRRTLAAFGLLLATAAAVLFALPRWVGPDPDLGEGHEVAGSPEPAATDPPLPTTRDSEPTQDAATRRDADADADPQKWLDTLVRRRAGLEAIHVETWAKEEWDSLVRSAEAGDRALLAGDTADAAAHYRAAVEVADDLLATAPRVLEEALAAGAAAFEAGDAATATAHFELALAIDPDDARAAAGIARTATLPAVLLRVEAAETLRAAGDLAGARESFQQALALDALYEPARAGLDEVSNALAARAFERHLGLAYDALDELDFEAAATHLGAAEAARPGSEQVRRARGRLAEERTLRAIATRRRAARILEQNENFPAAAAEYRAILALDSNIAFARDGAARNDHRAALSQLVHRILDDPSVLFERERRVDAGDQISSAAAWLPEAPRLDSDAQRALRLIREAATPLKVVFESDAETEVVIRRVARLGAFERREVSLYPGQYTVIGTRRGYRDVRLAISILPGQAQGPIEVRCGDAI